METNDLKILAIDDNPDNLTALKAVVLDGLPGARLLTALNAPKGLEVARAEDPDVILLDSVMPGMDAYAVCQKLKEDERLGTIPVLFLTAVRTDRDSRVKALEAGADGFLLTPFDEVELNAQIRAMVKIKAANRLRRLQEEQLAALVTERTRELERELAGRQQAEAKLRESEKLYRSLFENMLNGFAYCRMLFEDGKPHDFIYLAVNDAFQTQTGLKNVVGRKVTEVIPGIRDVDPQLFEIYGRVAMTGQSERFEMFVEALQSWFWVSVYSPAHEHFVAVFDVITERKRAEKKLRDSEAFTRAVMDHLPIGVAVNSVDRAVDFTYMNDKFPKFYRTTREALAEPDAFWERVYEDPAFREEIKKRVLDDCASGDPERMHWEDVPIARNGEETTFICARNMPVPGKQLMISTVWDVTERKRAEDEREKLQAQLIQAQKMESVGRLAGGVAHDFNNMLGIVLGHADMALDKVDPAQPIFADLLEIRKAAERSANLTRQLLAFARKQTVAPKVLDLNETVEGMLKMLRRLIGEDIDLAWLPGAGLWPVRMDPSQIDQVLANLCVNARDAIESVGKVTIESRNVAFDDAYCAEHPGFVPGEYVLLAVSDNGCGMDKKTLDRLFEPFFTTKEMGKGTGLGLATVYGIVKQNDGFINVYSEPGKGSTFRIYLPRHAAKVERMRKEGPAAPAARGHETILLVEDELAILRLTTMMLEHQGYTVLAASTPGEAIRLAEAHPGEIHLLLTDVVMPEMNGRDLAKNLMSLYPHVKRLFTSGYTANVIAHHGVLDEGVHFIQKPFSREDLAAKVREVLDRE